MSEKISLDSSDIDYFFVSPKILFIFLIFKKMIHS